MYVVLDLKCLEISFWVCEFYISKSATLYDCQWTPELYSLVLQILMKSFKCFRTCFKHETFCARRYIKRMMKYLLILCCLQRTVNFISLATYCCQLMKPFHLSVLSQSFHKSAIDTCDLAVRNVALAGYRSLKRKKILNQILI